MTETADRLETRAARVHFEGVKAVDDVDFDLRRGEILGLIGPNGAGKTTLVNVLTGFQRVLRGSVWLGDEEVTGWPPHRLAQFGIARTFQNLRLFPDLTVADNVLVAAVANGLSRKAAQARTDELLELFALAEKAGERASALPQGEERRLGIARALATNPTFVLLDEPAAGLNEVESRELVRTIAHFRDSFACGVVVIEHDMSVIMGVAERVHVLDHGRTLKIGTPQEVRQDAAVIEAYLGTKKEPRAAHD